VLTGPYIKTGRTLTTNYPHPELSLLTLTNIVKEYGFCVKIQAGKQEPLAKKWTANTFSAIAFFHFLWAPVI